MKNVALLNEFENKYWKQNKLIMGIDEAGRGPICGPLVVGCVVLPIDYKNNEINDSKKLSDNKRRELFELIKKDAIFYDVSIIEPKVIDELNILEGTRLGMLELSKKFDVYKVLTDAVKIDNEKNIPIIKGDAKSISIAAASIIAKVTRDDIMIKLSLEHPEYELDKHKGYPTKKHLELIDKYGIYSIYRKSYKPCFNKKIRDF